MIGAIDVGSNSIRMCIAQVCGKGAYKPLETLTVPVRLGVDTFSIGLISPKTIQAACDALAGLQKALKSYGVKDVRAVATSAVREASNADTFVDRAESATGIRLEVIDGIDETRLTYGVVRTNFKDIPDFYTTDTLLLDLGGGSAEITIFHRGQIIFSETRRIGTLRLREMLGSLPQGKLADLIQPLVGNVVESVKRLVPLGELRNFLLISSDAWHLRPGGERIEGAGGSVHIDRQEFLAAVNEVVQLSLPELVERHGLTIDEAETFTPALIAINTFLSATPASHLTLLRVNTLQSLLTAMASGGLMPAADEVEFQEQIASCAVGIGRKYHFDEPHALRVSHFALQLFDDLKELHGLGSVERMMLRVAGIFHDLGFYISTQAHHKHSMYLVANSECFGLTNEQMMLISIICRYHRRATPRSQHAEYMALTRQHRLLVSKLAAILRIADCLDRSHTGAIRRFTTILEGGQLVLEVATDEDVTLDELALESKANLFEQLYGLEVVMRRIPSVSA